MKDTETDEYQKYLQKLYYAKREKWNSFMVHNKATLGWLIDYFRHQNRETKIILLLLVFYLVFELFFYDSYVVFVLPTDYLTSEIESFILAFIILNLFLLYLHAVPKLFLAVAIVIRGREIPSLPDQFKTLKQIHQSPTLVIVISFVSFFAWTIIKILIDLILDPDFLVSGPIFWFSFSFLLPIVIIYIIYGLGFPNSAFKILMYYTPPD